MERGVGCEGCYGRGIRGGVSQRARGGRFLETRSVGLLVRAVYISRTNRNIFLIQQTTVRVQLSLDIKGAVVETARVDSLIGDTIGRVLLIPCAAASAPNYLGLNCLQLPSWRGVTLEITVYETQKYYISDLYKHTILQYSIVRRCVRSVSAKRRTEIRKGRAK